ncbi:MAG: formate dehydrogenase accessory sulfurtransferase FdhD [bacterium]|nr:formate dehydrogenase accessory sulfurtransferase FdhD [bacterium]
MALPEFIDLDIHEYSKAGIQAVTIPVSTEYPVVIKINNNPYVSIVCSGSDMEYLAVGHLISEGIILNLSEIEKIDINEENLEINITTVVNDDILERLFKIHSIASGCGQGRTSEVVLQNKKFTELPVIDPLVITSTMKEFLRSSDMHTKTRGVHSAALVTLAGENIVFFDEIGRHNAVDKIIGYSVKNNISLKETMIFSTGRLSSEIMYKALFASAPVIVSKAAPTTLSAELARRHGIILIGKVKSSSFSIFSGAEQVKVR